MKCILMLRYHQYIWDSFQQKPSGLYILAKGLDIFELEKQLVIQSAQNHKLIFVFGVSENDKQRMIWEAANAGIDVLPKDIEKDTGKKERTQHYESSNVFFHNAGILAKDFLQGAIDPKKIDGIIINNAETIHKDPGLQLCLAYYRSLNQDGYIKAFSEKCYEVADLKKAADLLWVRHILLFPRFEMNVKNSIREYEVQIIHISLRIGKNENDKNTSKNQVDGFEPIISQQLSKAFDLLTSLHLAFMNEYGSILKLNANESLVFHQKTLEKRATTDEQIKVLESIMFFRKAFFILLHENPMIFNDFLETVQSKSSGPYHPLWYEFPQAASLFHVANQYAEENIPNPKLQWILHLIQTLSKYERILVLAEGHGTVSMICEFLVGFTPVTNSTNIQIPIVVDENNNSSITENLGSIEIDDEPLINPEQFGVIEPPMILVQELHAQADAFEKFQPDVIIFWDVTLLSLRRLEVYNSRYNKNVVAYLLSYPEAKEIENMNHAAQMENNSFISSITTLKSLSLLQLNPFTFGDRPIIADDREFRSYLPLGLLRAGFRVIPALITVGDYVLSDEIVIERKA